MRLSLEDVCFSYDAHAAGQALSHVSLSVAPGEVLGVMGRTGSGKSTLLDVMARLDQLGLGRVLVDGADVASERAARNRLARGLGYVFQQPERQFFESTVEREMAFALRCRGVVGEAARERMVHALEAVGLGLDALGQRSPLTLSGGQQRRVALASVLACEPELLLLDEPTAGLDPRTRTAVLTAVSAAARGGAAVVMVSHDADALAAVADRLAVLEEGRVTCEGPTRELLGDAALMRAHGLEGCCAARLAEALAAAGVAVAPGALTADELADSLAAALAGRQS